METKHFQYVKNRSEILSFKYNLFVLFVIKNSIAFTSLYRNVYICSDTSGVRMKPLCT